MENKCCENLYIKLLVEWVEFNRVWWMMMIIVRWFSSVDVFDFK